MTDPSRVNEAKREMRREMRAFLAALDRNKITRKSEDICRILAAEFDHLTESAAADSSAPNVKPTAVMFYAPSADEPDLGQFAARCASRGTPLAAPVIDWDAGTMTPAKIATLPAAPKGNGPNEIPSPPASPHNTPPGWTIRRHGIREPDSTAPLLPLRSLAVVFVPGLAFDTLGNRLGRGAGFYDRFLARADLRHVLKIGVAFAGQIRPIVPIMPGDIAMDGVVTEAGFVWVK